MSTTNNDITKDGSAFEHEIVSCAIGRRGRPTCDRLRSDAATVDAVLNAWQWL